jgi:glutathione S-transferase
MDLFVAVDDYCLQKVLITASLAGVKVNLFQDQDHASLIKLDPRAKSMVLRTSLGCITQHNAILRYLGDISPLCPLVGSSEEEYASVCQWLDFSWNEIGEYFYEWLQYCSSVEIVLIANRLLVII